MKITTTDIKGLILDAFKAVGKGQGLGARECIALDAYADADVQAQARAEDVEEHWWDYPRQVKDFAFSYALIYNNIDGVRFHMPALMTADLEGLGHDLDIALYMTLCIHPLKGQPRSPHHGHRVYVDYLKSVQVQARIDYYGFDKKQLHAIAMYLLWQMHHKWHHHFFVPREERHEAVRKSHESSLKYAGKGDYTLTLDEAIAIQDEEHRIVRDWFAAGGVDPEAFEFDDEDDEQEQP